MKIYFCGSIRGGRADAAMYHRIISHIQETDDVLTEHVGDLSRSVLEQGRCKDEQIYKQDTSWLREADLVIAECTSPSLGVGYELAYAESHQIPCYLFYQKKRTQLSAMLNGDPYYHICSYETEEDLMSLIDGVLKEHR